MEGKYDIHTQVMNESTGVWETLHIDNRCSRKDFELSDISAQDVGGEPGQEFRIQLIDPEEGDERKRIIDEIQIESS